MTAARAALLTSVLSVLAGACGGTSSPAQQGPQLPVASAGPDQAVASGAVVTLDGSGSHNPAGATLSYQWTQASGPAASLSSASAVRPTFTAPVVAAGQPAVALSFSLTVTSTSGASAPATVAVTVSPAAQANPPPVASAGPDQAVSSGAAVTLDGSGSHDPDGQAIAYAWTQTAGPAVALSSSTAAGPTFTAPTVSSGSPPVTLVFSLVVTDATASSSPDTVTVTVNAAGTTNPTPPGTPAPAPPDPNPPPTGGSGSNRFQMGAAQGLYVVDPARGEPSVQGFLVVTLDKGAIPAGGTVTLNGIPMLRDPSLNGSYWRVDPAGTQPVVGSGGRIVLVATVTDAGSVVQRTLVLPCPADVAVASTPPVGAALAVGTPVHLTTTADLTLNVGIAPLAGIYPQAMLWGYDPATRALVASGSPQNIPPGPVSLDVPVLATSAAAYLLDLRWPGHWVIDGETGGFCGLAKRWTYTR